MIKIDLKLVFIVSKILTRFFKVIDQKYKFKFEQDVFLLNRANLNLKTQYFIFNNIFFVQSLFEP